MPTAATAQRARHAARRRRRPAAGAARRGPDLPQPRDAEGPGADLGADRRAAAGPGRPRVVARGAGLVAGPGGGRDRPTPGPMRCRSVRTSPSRGRASCASLRPGEQVRRRPPGPSPIMRRADLVGVSHHDVPAETPLSDLYAMLHPGADLLVTQGADGGLLIRLGPMARPRSLRYLPTATDRETDPTGAGDTFLAALQASVLRPAIVGRRRSRRPARTCASRPRPDRWSSRGRASTACRIGRPSWSVGHGSGSAGGRPDRGQPGGAVEAP